MNQELRDFVCALWLVAVPPAVAAAAFGLEGLVHGWWL